MFEDPNGNILLLRRSASGDHPNEYGFPAGHVESGETSEEAARREAREEVGDVPAGDLSLFDKGDGFHTFKQNVQDQFEPKLNHEHTGHVWASKDNLPEPLHPGVARLMGAMGKGPLGKGADGMPIKGGKQSPFDPGTSPEVNLDAEQRRDSRGEFAGEGEVSGSSTSARERNDHGGRTAGGETEGSGWSSSELRDYADEKPPGVGADDAAKEAEHTATIKFNGDFDMAGLLKHLHHLGAIGASRGVEAIDADDKPVRFGWDGDGADKIVEAEIDGKDVLAGDETPHDVAFDSIDSTLRRWLALDSSVREYDDDGHLHVKSSIISKAIVSPYLGKEIPDFELLGLDPDRMYNLLRDPDELENAAASFHGKPLLLKHSPTDAKDHKTDLVIGAVYNPYFENRDLKAELVVWPESRDRAD